MRSKETTAAGINRWQDTQADYFSGTKHELIGARICKAAWFPKELEPEWKKNGEPYLGNNGKQRLKRTYAASGRPDVELWHRRDAQGEEFWIVRIAVDGAEATRRSQAEHERQKQSAREDAERRRMREEEQARNRQAAAPTVRRLLTRYPELFCIDGEILTREDGTRRQELTFYGRNLEVLTRYGLVTAEMLATATDAHSGSGHLHDGRSFFLYLSKDYYSVRLWTEDSPRERKHFPVTEARAVLKAIANKPEAPA